MSQDRWIIVGISGVTCGGKTTLAAKLNSAIPNSSIISQDDYFLDVNDPRHVWVPELNHINFDVVSALDMERMHVDVLRRFRSTEGVGGNVNGSATSSRLDECSNVEALAEALNRKLEETRVKVLIVEGFCIFSYKPIADLCHLKYFFTLKKNECCSRRVERVYEPPDCPGYFEKCVWPQYLNFLAETKSMKDVKYFDGDTELPLKEVLTDIYQLLL